MVAGLSVNGPMLITARFVQGIGAAMILPSTLSSLNALFVGRARVVAFAVYGSAIGGMAALGPLLGRLAGDRLLLALGVLDQHPGGAARGRRHHPGAARDA